MEIDRNMTGSFLVLIDKDTIQIKAHKVTKVPKICQSKSKFENGCLPWIGLS